MKLRTKALIIISVSIASLITLPTIIFAFNPRPDNNMATGPSSPPSPVGFMLMTGLVFGIPTVLFLERVVLSRLAKLSDSVDSIRSSGDLSFRISMTGKDELTSLADKINEMLASLEEAQTELQSMNEKLRVVGSLTRHDARNKLSAVTNNVYLAKRMLASDHKAMEYLKEIESAIEQTTIIFDFARTYERLRVEELAYIDLEKTVEEAISLFPDLQGVKVVNGCHGLTVLADSLLRQLFYNLIDNSLKHGGKVTQIKVYYEEMGKDQLRLACEDDGIGIYEDEKEKIFIEGYGKNTGLGLYLISKMCEVYGWAIQETGKHGKGAQFAITIPKTKRSGKENYYLH